MLSIFIFTFLFTSFLDILNYSVYASIGEVSNEEVLLNNQLSSFEDYSLEVDSTSNELIKTLLYEEIFTMEGDVDVHNCKKRIEEKYDFSNMSKYDIAEWLYIKGLISYRQKIECFCDLILKRDFSNTLCIEGILDQLQNYSNEDMNGVSRTRNLTPSIHKKIEAIFNLSYNKYNTTHLTSISQEKLYNSKNFQFHYDSSMTMESAVESTAFYFEAVRQKFIDLGFSQPRLDMFNSKYQIFLDSKQAEDSNVLASTVKLLDGMNTCSSYMVIYNFSGFDDDLKETIVHEYFHAIQNAYNHQSGWFKEACANWATTVICKAYPNTQRWINHFIFNSTGISLPSTSGYGAVLFPITIEVDYGGIESIIAIYKEYNNFAPDIPFTTLKKVVTKGIQNCGNSGDFDYIYRTMVSQLINTRHWYKEKMDDKVENPWTNVKPIDIFSVSKPNTISRNLEYFSSHYYQITIPSNFTHSIRTNVQFKGTGGAVQIYQKDNEGNHQISYINSSFNDAYTIDIDDVGNTIKELVIIVSNTNDGESIDYSLNTFLSNHNYIDHYCTICNHYTETHDYHNPYTWVNHTQHLSTCGCGATAKEGHAVRKGSSICLLCGGTADIGFNEINLLMSNIKYITENGSYMLANGVFILVEEDIEQYLMGNLFFLCQYDYKFI